jgi:hypothetical protein
MKIHFAILVLATGLVRATAGTILQLDDEQHITGLTHHEPDHMILVNGSVSDNIALRFNPGAHVHVMRTSDGQIFASAVKALGSSALPQKKIPGLASTFSRSGRFEVRIPEATPNRRTTYAVSYHKHSHNKCAKRE